MIYTDLMLQNYNSSKTTKPYVAKESSFFVYSLSLLTEANNDLINFTKNARIKYILSENDSDVYLREFSFVDTFNTVVEWFISIIEKLTSKFVSIMDKFLQINAINSNLKAIDKAIKSGTNFSFETTFDRFNFTIVDEIPSTVIKNRIVESYNYLISQLGTLNGENSITYALEEIRKHLYDSQDLDTYFSNLRGKLLNTGSISENDYATALFKAYRGSGEKLDPVCKTEDVVEAYNRYTSIKDTKRSIKDESNSIVKVANEYLRNIQKIKITDYLDHNYTFKTDEEVAFNKTMVGYMQFIKKALEISVMAYSAKLDAIRDRAAQDRNILLLAARYIERGVN